MLMQLKLTESGIIERTSDLELVRQVQQQTEEALIALYHRYGTLVYSIAYRILGNQQDAEEVTQDVFWRLWEKSDQFDATRGAFGAWLASITRYSAIDYLRKRTRQIPLQEITVWDESLLVETEDQELQQRMLAALQNLSAEQQEAIALAYFQGMSQTEIADYLGRPLGTVKSHIRQGMQRLRQIWLSE